MVILCLRYKTNAPGKKSIELKIKAFFPFNSLASVRELLTLLGRNQYAANSS